MIPYTCRWSIQYCWSSLSTVLFFPILVAPNLQLELTFHSCSGALKSNIGHLEGASGIAGVIKTILALEKAVIPPNANFRQINPRIDTELLRIKLNKSSGLAKLSIPKTNSRT